MLIFVQFVVGYMLSCGFTGLVNRLYPCFAGVLCPNCSSSIVLLPRFAAFISAMTFTLSGVNSSSCMLSYSISPASS